MQSRFVAYLKLLHFTPLATVVTVTALLAWIIGGAGLTFGELARLLLAMLGGQVVVGVVNELVDAEPDRLTKPSKPIPAGLVSRRGARFLGVAGFALMTLAGLSLGLESFLILLGGTGIGVVYSFWFKRSRYAWLPYLVALPLVPVWVAMSIDRYQRALLLLYPLGALAVLGVQLAQSIPDIEADRAAGIDSLTTRLGERRSLVLCWASLLGSSALAFVAMLARDGWRWWAAAPGLIVVALIGFDVGLYRRNRRAGALAAFPCMAASAAMLALGWVASIYR